MNAECGGGTQVGGDARATAAVVARNAPDNRLTLTPDPFSGLRPDKARRRERGGSAGPLVLPQPM
jgi:hypothetical protein